MLEKYVLITENWADAFCDLVSISAFSAIPTKTSSMTISGIIPTARIIRKTLSLRLLKKALLRFKIITHSPFSIYILGLLGIFFDLFPQPSYMNINSAHITGIFITPDDA